MLIEFEFVTRDVFLSNIKRKKLVKSNREYLKKTILDIYIKIELNVITYEFLEVRCMMNNSSIVREVNLRGTNCRAPGQAP